MLSYQEAYKIAAEVHKGQKDKAGGPYIDFLQNVADYLKNKGESEEVQTLAILQDLITASTKKTPEDVIAMGVPADMVELIQKMTYHKNQGWIDEYSCNPQGQPRCRKGKGRYLDHAHGRQVHPAPGTPGTQDQVPPPQVQGRHRGPGSVKGEVSP